MSYIDRVLDRLLPPQERAADLNDGATALRIAREIKDASGRKACFLPQDTAAWMRWPTALSEWHGALEYGEHVRVSTSTADQIARHIGRKRAISGVTAYTGAVTPLTPEERRAAGLPPQTWAGPGADPDWEEEVAPSFGL